MGKPQLQRRINTRHTDLRKEGANKVLLYEMLRAMYRDCAWYVTADPDGAYYYGVTARRSSKYAVLLTRVHGGSPTARKFQHNKIFPCLLPVTDLTFEHAQAFAVKFNYFTKFTIDKIGKDEFMRRLLKRVATRRLAMNLPLSQAKFFIDRMYDLYGLIESGWAVNYWDHESRVIAAGIYLRF